MEGVRGEGKPLQITKGFSWSPQIICTTTSRKRGNQFSAALQAASKTLADLADTTLNQS